MVRKAPKQKTIKRLFALSGNTCAFPDCDKTMVGQDGTVLGEVCHIEAAEKGGERYNPNQTDEERRVFENLVLFCSEHHKVTDNIDLYSPERLREIKAAHEKQYEERPYSVPAGLVEQVRDALQAQYQISNTGSGTQIVRVGLGYSDVKTIVHDLFVANFPKLQEIALRTAEERVGRLGEILVSQLSNELKPEELQVFAEPDFQYILTLAANTAARSHEDRQLEMLATLIARRLSSQDSDFLRLACNQAMKIVGNLTASQLDVIALRFALVEHLDFVILENANADYFQHFILPFLSEVDNDFVFQHIASSGCASLVSVSDDAGLNFPGFNHTVFWSKDDWGKDQGTEYQRDAHFAVRARKLADLRGIRALQLTPAGIVLGACHIKVKTGNVVKIKGMFEKQTAEWERERKRVEMIRKGSRRPGKKDHVVSAG